MLLTSKRQASTNPVVKWARGMVGRSAEVGAPPSWPSTANDSVAVQSGEIVVASWERRRDRRAAFALFLFVLVVYLATAAYTVNQVNDNRAMSLTAWSVGTQGTFALPEAWRDEIPWQVDGVDGRLYTDRFPGTALWGAPFHTLTKWMLDRGTPGHPMLLNYAPSGVAAATGTALAVMLSFHVFRRLANRPEAVWATLVLAFATGTWSISADALWNHGITHLTLVAGLLALTDGKHARSGLAYAAAVITRPQTAVVPAIMGIWKGWTTRSLRPVMLVGAVSLLGVAAMAAYSRTLFGTWLPIAGYGEQKVQQVATIPLMDFVQRMALALAHPQRGILLYAPFLLVLVPFTGRGWRVSPWWVRASAIAGVMYLVVQMRSNAYHGGAHFFGARLPLETLVLSTPLMLRTWQAYVSKTRIWRRACLALVAVALVMHAAGATVFSTRTGGAADWQTRMADLCAEQPELHGC